MTHQPSELISKNVQLKLRMLYDRVISVIVIVGYCIYTGHIKKQRCSNVEDYFGVGKQTECNL